MLNITSNSNGFTVEAINNIYYPDNGTLTFGPNQVIMIIDDVSDMVTFKDNANRRTLFSGIIGQISINGVVVTRDNIIEKFAEVATSQGGGGGDMSNYYTKAQSDAKYATRTMFGDVEMRIDDVEMRVDDFEVQVNEQLAGKQDTLTAGTNITIENNVISATGGGDMSNYYTKSEVDGLIPSVEGYFDGAEYDSISKRINFKHGQTVKAYIDATAFIKDGMVSNVEISGGNLVITFNADAGKETITIPLTDIFNPENYYTKSEVYNKSEIDTMIGNIQTILESI